MGEDQAEYITEALDLLRGTTLEISSPEKVIERRDGKLVEVERSAFVKIFTSFKRELKTISGDELKVWLYLALSINRFSKKANPGLRKIAEDTGLAVNTVRGIVERLEMSQLLDVEKADGKGNQYRPADYASVSKFDTVPPTVSKNDETVSILEPTVSTLRGENAQLELTRETRVSTTKRQLANTSIEAAIFGGMPITEEMMIEARLKDEAPKMFEAALGFSRPLAWTSDKDWTAFGAWVLDVYRTDPKAFERFEIWRNTPYVKGSISNNRIRGFINEFYDAWDMFKKLDVGIETTTPVQVDSFGIPETY